MDPTDRFATDPQVRAMRRIFAQMEAAQSKVLDALAVSPFDVRIRPIREQALRLFEKSWVTAMHSGIVTSEEEAAVLYIFCLVHALKGNRIDVPPEVLPRHEKIEQFLGESSQ
jgi:hypothetical protein